MALYPTLESFPYISIGQSTDQKVLKSNFDELGNIQVKRKWFYPRRSLTLLYSNSEDVDIRTLEQFYINRNGGFNAFTFIMPDDLSETFTGEYVCSGDSSAIIFNLPCKDATAVIIYIDTNIQTEGSNYVITENGGQDGVDSIEFTVAPGAGARVTMDFIGRLAVRCRFVDTIDVVRSRISRGFNDITVRLYGTLFDE